MQLSHAAQLLQQANRIAVLTGAGISTESGIPDFRSDAGLWNRHTEHKLSSEYFYYNPKDFWKFYKELFSLKVAETFQPNAGHRFLVELESLGKDVTIITQNIDGLHQKAGSTRVYEVHGNAKGAHCHACMTPYPLDYIMKMDVPVCTNEYCKEILKPNIVLFGDAVQELEPSVAAVENADLFIVMGSSLKVTPVNQLVPIANSDSKRHLLLINRDPAEFEEMFEVVIHAGIGETVNKIRELFAVE
ncbi:NAD-dependent protein deacylase [Brevibacillus ginsengisoli]|uniref:NAD-dependent protein deacylase n=1 Tax=Brevibacillus ginsengisoli TaxID=363854 RepID=UPI003CF1D789